MKRFHNEDKAEADATKTQCAALCYRQDDKGKTRILLITSRDTGRWVVPKGWPVAGKSAARSAAQEAFEEAGVEGTVSDDCIGVYSYGKVLGSKRILPCVVAVYPLRVTGLKEDFPEKGQRRLKWFRPQAAATKVAEPDLSAILAAFAPPPEADPAPGESR
jgi:8-oxo-dGTP pyrophosphatase MutT (NUDIX family)